MNSYADLTTLKSSSYLNITVTDYDVYLRKLLESASREIDRLCERYFYCVTGTRYYDGAGRKLFIRDDLLYITSLATDEDGDGTYENTFETSDYIAYPLNTFPKTRLELASGGNYGSFASGILNGVKLVGIFGYGDGISITPYYASGTTTAEELDISETDVDVADATKLAVGQTIRVEAEQMFVESISTNTLTVRRGVNGMVAATHATGKTISIYEFPAPITQACLIMAMRRWKRKDTGYADVISSPELGQISVWKGLDPDVEEIISEYKKWWY